MIGVSYKDFWELNPKTLEPFIEAFSLRNKYNDSQMWTLGQYIQLAIASCMSKKAKYPAKPFTHVDTEAEMRVKIIKKMREIQSRFKGR